MPRKKKVVKLFTLDTETDGLAGALRRIAIYDGVQVIYGYTFSDIEPVLIEASKEYNVHVYIHNADFDLRKCPEIFRDKNVRWNMCLNINRRYTTLACEHYTIHDSFQMLPMSLAKASKDFNLEHGKLDLWEAVQREYPGRYKSHVEFLSKCDLNDPLYLEYLGYDVKALYELIFKLSEVSTIPIEKLVKCPTTASMSKYLLRHGYNGVPFKGLEAVKTDFEIMTLNRYWLSEKPLKEFPEVSYRELEYKIREAYYGGRTEVFTPHLQGDIKGSVKGYHYDVNSLYPYVCHAFDYPVGVPEYFTDKDMMTYRWRIWCKYHRGLGFLKCKVFVPKQKIPPLPSRLEKLCFLTGYIEGSWTFNELEYAIKNCGVRIIEMIEMIYFKSTHKVYKNFIGIFADLKEQASKDENEALRTFCKLIMNTSYGWTCMSRDDKSEFDYIEKYEKYRDENRLIAVNHELGYCEVKSIVRTETIQVQVGAYVASYARLVLLDALRKQAEAGEVYYCDTDSIVCSTPLPDDMVDPHTLGKWKLEKHLKSGLFLQPKLYAENSIEEDTEIKFKGVTKERQKTLTYDFYADIYKALCNHQKGTFEIEQNIERLPSLKTAQKRGINPNTLIITSKNLNLENTQKRNVNYKRNFSEAWHMDSFEIFNNFHFADIDLSRGDFFEKRRTN